MGKEEILSIDQFSLEEIQGVARRLLDFGKERNIWIFDGEMGAGKTTLTKSICQEFGVVDLVSSPTFSIVNEYETLEGQVCYHFDFYRLKSPEEALDIGVEEYFDSGELCLIEWPSKIEGLIPEDHLEISLTTTSNTSRALKATIR
ncbi:tRNA (adenosine(37)-N6)-threonylcarbamoyltransferase complex ATPase subunit type 1 TsaE [Flammeovirgaceae bacterium SG7u.111]|nr:tRNA (adenosine(37)-N6)-threonylcarbamoyltransferase complex ATPase subunit type 1 TsaE [Flammeovirgaceae bacterium SG7u.132]WPO35255.1 tRNA (adenosine(37)-N6)-threonylcarbamoyltransferase complex ATPase subunit type 1 TsaE [Flammeovirgaceae bacterium SG7u.111]